jgi:succinate dehydrogenase assembly factor 2
MHHLSRTIAVARTLARPAPRRTFALSRPVFHRPTTKDDPYPLPLSPEHVSPERDPPKAQADEPIQLDKEVDLSDPALPFPDPLPRDGESVEQMRARLVYQTRKRGTLESDLLMSTFAKEHMGTMSEFELREFDKVSCPAPPC